ncbi:MAG: cupin domain-containing protein [Anaerolineales bacterium]|nr:cupin domain-containing protein [Anaerolineae bacterium]PWB50918.1 MAG: cupin domain-containing protein [Anaerolineales bacterium]
MITINSDANPVQVLPGLTRRTLATGQSIMICEFTFDAHIEIPVHTHPHEQVGYLAKGRMEMIIDGKKYELKMGDTYCALPNVPHGAFSLEPSVMVDTFCPPREDYR